MKFKDFKVFFKDVATLTWNLNLPYKWIPSVSRTVCLMACTSDAGRVWLASLIIGNVRNCCLCGGHER